VLNNIAVDKKSVECFLYEITSESPQINKRREPPLLHRVCVPCERDPSRLVKFLDGTSRRILIWLDFQTLTTFQGLFYLLIYKGIPRKIIVQMRTIYAK